MAKKTKTTTKTTKKTTKVKVDPKAYEKVEKNSTKAPEYKKPSAKAPKYKVQKFKEKYKSGTYTSEYEPQIRENLNKITNWNYDPTQDANYQALAKVYGARGNIAAKDSLGDAAALNGGMGTSYAVSAAQQARNQYNQELASMIPQLEETAYNRATGTLSALMDMDNTMYGRFRDTESDRWNQYLQRYDQFRDYQGDRQFKYGADYDKYRDKVGDSQWLYEQRYQRYNDAVNQYQWAKNYNLDLYQLEKEEELANMASVSSGGGGGGGRRRGGGGGGRSYGGGGSTTTTDRSGLDKIINEAENKANPTYHPNSNLYYQSSGGTNVTPTKSPSSMTYSQAYNRNVLKKKK